MLQSQKRTEPDTAMKKLPIGIQTFEDIIKDNYLYIDKTKQALDLIQNGKYYFLSRPRRFGKSLFLSTLKNIFQAKKELFKDLYIYDKYDWNQSYPVINISFGKGTIHSREILDKKIIDILEESQDQLEVECKSTDLVDICFRDLIIKVYKKYSKKVVVLVDEYDKPILDNITNPDISNEIRDGLRNFYSVIKDSDEYVKFAFLTGVSKFSKVSLFSGLNNLEDITIDKKYSDICGYTQNDVETSFKEHLKDVDFEELKVWYNGYNWTGESVYNPFDILLFIAKGCEYRSYWFETATPTFLVELMKEKNYFLPKLDNLEASEELIGSFDVNDIKIETLLFQAGYLTIRQKETIMDDITYHLTYPNKEVQKSLNVYLYRYFTNIDQQQNTPFLKALVNDDFETQKQFLISLFASIPYNNFTNNKMYEKEGYYASVIYAYLSSLGINIIAEDVTNKGRIDLTIRFPKDEKIYILEFKVDERVQGSGLRVQDGEKTNSALEQIKQKNYHQKYQTSSTTYLIGIEFSKKDRNIGSFEWEKI
jgi:hypothetical protein